MRSISRREFGALLAAGVVSEAAGMQEMAEWIGSFVTEVPVRLVRGGEPFWVPS